MKIKIISVHPTVTRVEYNGTTSDIPTAWFPDRPAIGQIWDLNLHRDATDADRVAELNRFLGTA
jgi:hypothetical protein